MNKVVFLDKDGTLVKYNTYGSAPNKESILTDELMEEKVLEGLRYLQDKGYKLIIVSNQPWIAKKVVTKKEIEYLFRDLIKKLKQENIQIDDYYYCPHQSSDNCNCKKPKNGMILKATKKHDVSLTESYIIGDTDQDIFAGKNSGIKTVLVLTGEGKKFKETVKADFVIEELNSISKIL